MPLRSAGDIIFDKTCDPCSLDHPPVENALPCTTQCHQNPCPNTCHRFWFRHAAEAQHRLLVVHKFQALRLGSFRFQLTGGLQDPNSAQIIRVWNRQQTTQISRNVGFEHGGTPTPKPTTRARPFTLQTANVLWRLQVPVQIDCASDGKNARCRVVLRKYLGSAENSARYGKASSGLDTDDADPIWPFEDDQSDDAGRERLQQTFMRRIKQRR